VELLAEIDYTTKPDAQDASKAKLAPKNQTEPTADVYEIWDKERQLVFWVTDNLEVPLDVQEDTMQFDGFFPTPLPPLGRFDTANTIPVCDYQLVRGKYDELDELNQRCTQLSKALVVRFGPINNSTVIENDNVAVLLKVSLWNACAARAVGVTDVLVHECACIRAWNRRKVKLSSDDAIAFKRACAQVADL
jgi:hypothetical protein